MRSWRREDETPLVKGVFRCVVTGVSVQGKNTSKYSHLNDDLNKRRLITTGHHLPYNPELKARARELRNNMTPVPDFQAKTD